MLEDYDGAQVSSPAAIGAGCGAGSEVAVANSGGGCGKTVRFQSRPKKLCHINEESR